MANGWYDRELAEHHFWKQSNHLVHGTKLWHKVRLERPGYTCANLFWWYNMYSGIEISITPRPLYLADGRKVFDVHSFPPAVRPMIKNDLGPFPFPAFWGPSAGIESSEWIAKSARWVENHYRPHLSLVYLPHLDYNLQRLGPDDPRIAEDCRAIDAVVARLLEFYRKRDVRPILLSEYGITSVNRTIALNREFRAQHWIMVKDELGRETLDCGACKVFAIADHQIAHIYVKDEALLQPAKELVEQLDGVAYVLDQEGQRAAGIAHERSGDLVAVAETNAWFNYYYWEEDEKAPDFARCVDIHRKYGYDPVELFLDPRITAPKLKIATTLLKRKLGFRALMDVIPLDATLVRGSHGAIPPDSSEWPVLIGTGDSSEPIDATAVHDRLFAALV